MEKHQLLAVLAIGCLWTTSAMGGIIPVGQFDDFEDGSTVGWVHGADGPSPPMNVPNGGPQGLGDSYLQIISTGTFGPGSRMAVLNRSRWAGDYVTDEVTMILAQMANLGASSLSMRIGVQGVSGSSTGRYVSGTAVALPNDGLWHDVAFELSGSALTSAGGPLALADVLANVTEVRFISSSTAQWKADPIAGALGIDNTTAVPEPALALFLLPGVTFLLRRNRNSFLPVQQNLFGHDLPQVLYK